MELLKNFDELKQTSEFLNLLIRQGNTALFLLMDKLKINLPLLNGPQGLSLIRPSVPLTIDLIEDDIDEKDFIDKKKEILKCTICEEVYKVFDPKEYQKHRHKGKCKPNTTVIIRTFINNKVVEELFKFSSFDNLLTVKNKLVTYFQDNTLLIPQHIQKILKLRSSQRKNNSRSWETELDSSYLRLVFGGKELSNNRILKTYGIQDGSIIFLVFLSNKHSLQGVSA